MSSENKKIKAELQKKKAINLRHKGRSSSKEESEGGGEGMDREGADCVGKSSFTLAACLLSSKSNNLSWFYGYSNKERKL